MNNNKRNRKFSMRAIFAKRSNLSTNDQTGFASSESYVKAVNRIYYQEINDIGRFVKFAESHSISQK
jgi:hypothetical protein